MQVEEEGAEERLTFLFEWTPQVMCKGDYYTPDYAENESFILMDIKRENGGSLSAGSIPADVIMDVCMDICDDWGFDEHIDIDISKYK